MLHMLNIYRDIFRISGTCAFSSAGAIARLPLAMMTLGIVTMLSEMRGKYGLAGAVAASLALSNALISPRISRLVDSYGQSRVLIPTTIAAVACLMGLVLAARLDAPNWVLFAFSIGAGIMPSISALVRTRWTEIYRGTPSLRAAFAFEAVIDEVTYIVGPIVVVGLSIALFSEAGLMLAILLLVAGSAWLSVQKATEPPVYSVNAGGGSVIGHQPLQVVALSLVAIGAIFGATEVTAIAFAESEGNKFGASIALSLYGVGSLIAGFVFGAVKLRVSFTIQFIATIGLAAVATLSLLAIHNISSLVIVLFVSGFAASPVLIAAMALVEKSVSPAQVTEGMTWAITGLGVGAALGALVSGWLIDIHGAFSGFFVAILAGAVALTAAFLGQRGLADIRPGGS